MIARTPPPTTTGSSAARKRGWPVPLASASSRLTTSSFAASRGDDAPSTPSLSFHNTGRSTSSAAVRRVTTPPSFAATVSPFMHRVAFPPLATGGDDEYDIARHTLGTVPEGGHSYDDDDDDDDDPLTQSTDATGSQDHWDDDCHDDGSALWADDSCSGGRCQDETDGPGDAMVGTTVACRAGCGSANGHWFSGGGGFRMPLDDDDCTPPTKRPRIMDDGARQRDRGSFQPDDDVEMTSGNGTNIGGGQHDGRVADSKDPPPGRCHVCSPETPDTDHAFVAATAPSSSSFVCPETYRPPQ